MPATEVYEAQIGVLRLQIQQLQASEESKSLAAVQRLNVEALPKYDGTLQVDLQRWIDAIEATVTLKGYRHGLLAKHRATRAEERSPGLGIRPCGSDSNLDLGETRGRAAIPRPGADAASRNSVDGYWPSNQKISTQQNEGPGTSGSIQFSSSETTHRPM